VISPQLGKLAFSWAMVIILLAGGLLFYVKRGSPEFVITVITLAMGVAFLGIIALVVKLFGR
jgi:uncharacterized membrane protein